MATSLYPVGHSDRLRDGFVRRMLGIVVIEDARARSRPRPPAFMPRCSVYSLNNDAFHMILHCPIANRHSRQREALADAPIE